MNLMKLAFRFIIGKPVTFIFISIMLGFSLVSINLLTGRIYSNLTAYRITSKLDNINYVYFQPENPKRAFEISGNYYEGEKNSNIELRDAKETLEYALEQLDGVKFVSCEKSYSAIVESDNFFTADNYTEVKALDKEILTMIHLPLTSGRWLDESRNDNYIEAVISSDFNDFEVGDTFNILLNAMDGEITTVEVHIVGVLKDPVYQLAYSVSGNNLCSLDLVQWFDPQSKQMPSFFCSYDSISRFTDMYSTSNNCIIAFDDKMKESDINKNIETLRNYGFVSTKDTLKDGTVEQVKLNLYQYLPISIFLMLISIIGLISMTILNILQCQKHFAIFFISGCQWWQCIVINLLYILYSLLFSIAIFVSYFNISNMKEKSQFLMLTPYNIIVTLVFCLIVFLSSAAIPYILMKNLTPKEIITNNNE